MIKKIVFQEKILNLFDSEKKNKLSLMDIFEQYLYEALTKQYEEINLCDDDYRELYIRFRYRSYDGIIAQF